ncbi:uncharacterized protein LOC141851246 [Brevipalpus obovatus]|uniref:uncharacterized protein LOC141851246 n=1 Tax=Brevipalpus obovatus TaxID=246614 RepID=UPI003D9EADA5
MKSSIFFCCCLLLTEPVFGFSLSRTSTKTNSIPPEESTREPSEVSTTEKSPSSSQPSKLSDPSAFSLLLKQITSKLERPMINLKNGSAIPFTGIDATLVASGQSTSDEEGVGPAVSFEADGELPAESDFSGPEHNFFDSGSDLKVEISDLQPVFVKPPTNFQPILYPNRAMDGVHPGSSIPASVTIFPPKAFLLEKPYLTKPYAYPYGLSSWILGGVRAIERTGYWESLGSDDALNMPPTIRTAKPLVQKWVNLMPRGFKIQEKDKSEDEIAASLAYQPPLPPPVSLGPWLFGGIKEVTLPTWKLPPVHVERIEFVPFEHEKHRRQESYEDSVEDPETHRLYSIIPSAS